LTISEDKTHLTWINIHEAVKKLASKINLDYKPEIVVAISEGGWIPTRLLKTQIKSPRYYSIGCKNYDEEDNQLDEATITQGLEGLNLKNKSVLIVDEVADTGITMKKVHEYISQFEPKEIKTAVLHKKPKSVFNPDYISEDVGNTWIVYPWDIQ
jgi:uncharacterized protein